VQVVLLELLLKKEAEAAAAEASEYYYFNTSKNTSYHGNDFAAGSSIHMSSNIRTKVQFKIAQGGYVLFLSVATSIKVFSNIPITGTIIIRQDQEK
jgi:hypothetical protein